MLLAQISSQVCPRLETIFGDTYPSGEQG